MEVLKYLRNNGANLDVEGYDGTTAKSFLGKYFSFTVPELMEKISNFLPYIKMYPEITLKYRIKKFMRLKR